MTGFPYHSRSFLRCELQVHLAINALRFVALLRLRSAVTSRLDMSENTTTTYTTALGVWRRSGAVHISSLHETKIASFPLDFLRSCGDHTWEYILYVVSLLIEIDADHPGQLHDDQDKLIDLQNLPTSGYYHYIERGQSFAVSSGVTDVIPAGKASDVRLARGPEYFNYDIAPSGIEETTRSASSQATRSRPDQVAQGVLVNAFTLTS